MGDTPFVAKAEPRSMTLGDLVSLVAGVALGFAALGAFPGGAFVVFHDRWVVLVYAVMRLALLLAMASSVVAFGRVVAYRRMPRAAEWLALLVSASALATLPLFNVDGWVNVILANFPSTLQSWGFDGLRWSVAWLAVVSIGATFGVLYLGRRAFPPWLKTIGLAWLATIAQAGPLWAFGFLGDDLVSPRGGFGAGDLAILHREACVLFGYFPTGVFFGVPAVAASLGRIAGRRWAWPEWACVVASILVVIPLMMLFRWEIVDPSASWAAERAMALAWLVVVTLSSRFLLIRLAGPWRRWVEGPSDQERSRSSGTDSAASTR